MIRLSKVAEPDVLLRNRNDWTRDLLAAVGANDRDEIARVTKRYNHIDIKSALKEETREKCAYCEARVTDVAHGDIEHITPKSNARHQTFDWDNLTFSCQICNQHKSSKDGIVDPYVDEPDEHIFFVGPFVKGRSDMGARTVLELKLNRVPLIESRNREIERYANEIEKIFLIQDDRTRKLLFQSLLEDLDSGRPEFIAACRTAVAANRP